MRGQHLELMQHSPKLALFCKEKRFYIIHDKSVETQELKEATPLAFFST